MKWAVVRKGNWGCRLGVQTNEMGLKAINKHRFNDTSNWSVRRTRS